MKLTVTRADLQRELQLCQSVAERTSTVIPILRYVLLRATDKRLRIAATDIDTTVTTSIEARIEEDGEVAIEAKQLYNIVRSLPDEDVHLTLQENNSMLMESGTVKFRLPGLPAQDYPTLPTVGAGDAYTLPLAELKAMVSKVIFGISPLETRFQLNGALLKVQPKKIEMVSTDGHRMALISYPWAGGRKRTGTGADFIVLVPSKALHGILGLEGTEDAEVRFGASENQLYFEVGDQCLMARMIDINFPNYTSVIANDNDRRVLIDRERLLAALKRIALVANERTRAIRFDFVPGKLTVSSVNPERGDARETIPIDYAGTAFFMGLNATYMIDWLSVIDTPSVSLDLKNEDAQCIGRPWLKDDEELPYEYLSIVMPMRVA